MKIDRNLFNQVFTMAIIIILVIVFYVLLLMSMVIGRESITSDGLITPLLLIIIAITCLAIFSMLAKIESKLPKRKK